MDESANSYEVILTRHHVSDAVRHNLSQIKAVFSTLDHLALRVDGEDDLLMELVNSLADLFRGSLVRLFGVDIRPVSELGPFEEVDLDHTFTVLGRLLGMSAGINATAEPEPPQANGLAISKDSTWREANRQRLFDQVLRLEHELNRYRETLKDQLPPEADAAFLGLQRHVRTLRTEADLAVDAHDGRKSSGVA